ncbi:hypothetical protein [Streptomyces sp. NPDC089919]|uniref:hypothetical protein n=1 Tax=Streptomyces sp. NPDC089919 TaxID=3155188 RepID=UPI003428444D
MPAPQAPAPHRTPRTARAGAVRRRLAAALSVAVAATALAAGTGPAAAAPRQARHCVSPDGTDLNALYGVTERIVGPPGCAEAVAGERWVRALPSWTTAPAGAAYRYPAGYAPDLAAPMDDFAAKFVSATYVTDLGTRQERSRTVGREVLRTASTGPDGLPYASLVSPPLDPLAAGPHTTTVLLTMSAEHCDGLAPDPAANCLPEGTFPYTLDTPVTVVPRDAPGPQKTTGGPAPATHPRPTTHPKPAGRPKTTGRPGTTGHPKGGHGPKTGPRKTGAHQPGTHKPGTHKPGGHKHAVQKAGVHKTATHQAGSHRPGGRKSAVRPARSARGR